MRILYYTPTFLPACNGLVTRMQQTLRELSTRGDEALILTPCLPGLPREYAGFPVIGLPSVPLVMYPGMSIGLPWYPRGVLSRLRAFQPEVIHALDPITSLGWLAKHLAQQMEIPLMLSYHTNVPQYLHYYGCGGLEPFLWRYIAWMHAHATVTLCPSGVTRQLLQDHGITGVELWRSGVDTTQFHPSARSQSWRARLTEQHSDALLLLSVGRLAAEKEIEHLFGALAALNKDGTRPAHLVIVGDGPQARYLQQQARGLPITFLGRLTGAELATAYASSDIFCVPSASETFGNVSQEALAAGVPVVAARAGGTLDLVCDQRTGLLFDPGRTDQLVDALRLLRDQEDLRVRLGAAAHTIAQGWDWSASTASLCQIYERLHQQKAQVA